MRIAVEQEKMGKAMAHSLSQNELKYVVEMGKAMEHTWKLKETEQSSMDAWQSLLTDTNVAQTRKLELQKHIPKQLKSHTSGLDRIFRGL